MKKEKKEQKASFSGIFEKAGKDLSGIKQKEVEYEKKFLRERIGEEDEKKVRQLEYNREKQKEDYSRERKKVVVEAVGKKAEALSSIGQKSFSKVLGKTSVKVPKYSALNLVKQMGRESGALVREVEPKEIIQDNRSLFFKDEFKSEVKKDKGWLFS